MNQEADFYSVTLKTDIEGGYGSHKKGSTLKNLSKSQAESLHRVGFAEAPVAQKAAAPEPAPGDGPKK